MGQSPNSPARDPEQDAAQNNAAFARIVSLAAAHKLPIAAILLPHTHDLDKQADKFARAETLCQEHAVPCLDLRKTFAARHAAMTSLRLNALDSHPNAEYHAIVAEALAPYVSCLLLKGSCSTAAFPVLRQPVRQLHPRQPAARTRVILRRQRLGSVEAARPI